LSENQSKLQVKYEKEIYEISYILNKLENGRIYGINSNNRSDGSLEHNVSILRNQLNDLIYKIDNNKPSQQEIIERAYRKVFD